MANCDRILVVEDEANIIGFMSAILTANNYEVIKAVTGSESLMMITSYCPDLVILDLGLPDTDGLNILKSMREWSQIPIIVVSARSHEKDKVSALDLGADDYVTKPFSTGELLARVRTALRHKNQKETILTASLDGIFRCDDLLIDYTKRRVFLKGEEIRLTQIEYRIAALLSQYAGRVLTYDFLLKNVWGPNSSFDNQILRVNMANIRRKIEQNPAAPKYIFTEIGVGYRMAECD
ncbi:MAG: response regulator [Clostridia bacterium]